MHPTRPLLLHLTALALVACASSAGPRDGAADAGTTLDDDVHAGTPCAAGVQWLDPVTDPPLTIASWPAAGITGLSSGGFAVFHWDNTVGAIVRMIPSTGAWSRDATVVAEWAGRPVPDLATGPRLFVGESARGAMFGLVRPTTRDIAWNTAPTPEGTWGPVTVMDSPASMIGDLEFLADRVVVARYNFPIGHGAVAGVDVDTHNLATGALIDHQVWAPGDWSTGYYSNTDGPMLERDGERVFALRPRQEVLAPGVTVFSGPGSGVQLAANGMCCSAFASAVGAEHRVWVMHASDVHPRLQVDVVEGSTRRQRVWWSDREPQRGDSEFAIAAAGDGAILAYWDNHDLRVTVIDRDGGVRATASLPVHLAPEVFAGIQLARGTEGTFAVLWTAADPSVSWPNGNGGIARFRACGL